MTRTETPRFIVNVEGVVRRGDRYLLTVRSEHEPHAPGTLALPGGKLEPTDPQAGTLEAVLGRELLEELTVGDPDEITEVLWLTAAEVTAHPKAPPWTRATIAKAEQVRL